MASLSLAFDILARDRASKEFTKVGNAADDAGKKGDRFGKAMKAGLAVAAAAAVKLGKDAIQSASSLEQSTGAVETVFGKASAAVENYAKRSAKGIGLARDDYQQLAAVVGTQLQRMGQSQEESAKSTDKLITLGADLAATYGGSVSDAIGAVGSLLRGERDPIERYGVGINDAAIKADLLKHGLGDLTGAALEQAKGQATLRLLTEQTTKAQGASARESGTLQGQTQRLSAQYKDLSAQVGTALLPVITSGIEKFKSLAAFVDRNREVVIPLAAAVGGLTATVLAVNAATKAATAIQAAYTAVTKGGTLATLAQAAAAKVATASQWLLNAALTANPIGIVIVAVAALGAALVVAYKKSETFRNIVNAAFQKVLEGASKLLGGVQALFRALGNVPGFGWAKTAASAVGGARAAVDRLAQSLNNLPAKKTVTVTYQQVGSITSVPFKQRAAGGPVRAGEPYIVGEREPELFVPRQSGQILNQRQMVKAGLSGGTVGGVGQTDELLREQNALLAEQNALLGQQTALLGVLPRNTAREALVLQRAAGG